MIRIAALLAILAAACNSTSDVPVTTLVFDRPVDISFACYGALRITGGGSADPSQTVDTTAQPIASCDTRAQEVAMGATPPRPMGQEDLSGKGGTDITPVQYYGFVLESVAGSVALVNFDSKEPTAFAGGINQDVKPVDADPLTPGENGISVGDFPVAIATDKVGCYELTANAGSCDMSTLSINEAIGGSAGIHVNKLEVTNGKGEPVHAKPAAMVSEPPGGTIGVECPMQPTGLVYVAYPSCHMVAAVDSSSGSIVAGISFASGTPAIVAADAVSCPDECAGEPVTPGVRPVALDLEQDPTSGRRALLIGADNSSSLTIVELDPASKPMGTPQQIALEDHTPGKTLGVSAVTLSPQIGMGGSNDMLNDAMEPQFQFAYAVASDNSVRVAEVLNLYKECDTQVDPRYLHDVKDVSRLSCLPVGDPATPPRRPGAHGPGIELPGQGVPTSVAVVKVPRPPTDNRDPTQPSTLIGYFGVISSTNGSGYVFNIDDEHRADFVGGPEGPNGSLTNPLESMVPLDIANQLRDDVTDRGVVAEADINGSQMASCDAAQPPTDVTNGGSGGPRATGDPQYSVPGGYVASDKQPELPSIQKVLCQGADDTKPVSELLFQAPVPVRDLVFPDLRALAPQENWTLTWEGLLSLDQPNTSVDGPPVRTGDLTVNGSGMFLDDATQPFCDAGVEPSDIAQLRGCDPAQGDTQCPKGYTCFVHPESKVAGLGACMASDEASLLATACKDFLTTLRRYTVVKASTGELELIPRKHELRTTPVDGCTSDTQCQQLANYAAQNASSANPPDDKTPADPHTWTCALDPDRGGSPTKRCLETCQATSDCIDGYACENGFCMESVIPPQACVNAPQRYDLRAHDAFTVIGTLTGYVHPIIADKTGACVRDPNANPLDIGRIPLTAPPCDPTADPRTGALPGGGFEPNPCETTVAQSEVDPVFMPGTCTPANPSTQLVSRMADAIEFRNRQMSLTLVDPTYPGDQMCVGDRMGNLGRIPLVSSLFQIVFQQAAGFFPLTLNTSQAAMPVKVVRGPGQSIWVIDEGDFLATQLGESSTSGQLFRIESQALQTVNQIQ